VVDDGVIHVYVVFGSSPLLAVNVAEGFEQVVVTLLAVPMVTFGVEVFDETEAEAEPTQPSPFVTLNV
jgi:hypothetical protein